MVDPAPLSPEELDRLEDALEWVEDVAAIDDPSPAVRVRLAAYREILVASREALALEEVPGGLLDGVIAQAREAAGSPTPVAAPPTETRPRGVWERFRRSFLLPTLALAGTAALVLVIARPDPDAPVDGLEVAQREVPTEAAEGERGGPVDDQAARGPGGAPARDASTVVDTPAEPAALPAQVPAGNAAPAERIGDLGNASADSKQNTEEALKDLGRAKVPPNAEPSAAQVPGWDLIERADSARKAGDCRSAREDYMVAAEDDAPTVRARAYAGLGLCDQAAGNTDAAEENYSKARDLDGSVDTLIDKETSKPYRSSTKAAKPSAKRKPKARSAVSKDDPFSGI